MKRTIRRLPAAAALSVGAALLIVPSPAQASATVLESSLSLNGGIYADYDEDTDHACDVDTSGTFDAHQTSASGSLSLSVAGSASITNPDNAADTGSGATSAKASVTATSSAAGGLTIAATMSTNATVSTVLGAASGCELYAYSYGYGSVKFRVDRGGSVALNIPQSVGWSYLNIGRATDATYNDESWDAGLSRTAPTVNLALPAGYYQLYFSLDGSGASAPSADFGSAANSARMNATFTPAPLPVSTPPKGAAKGKAKGAGKKFAKLPASLACGSGSAQVKFTKKAKQVQKVVVLAGKKKVKTVKAPKKGKVKITKLPKKGVKVTVKLKLKNGKTVKVVRAYTAC